MIKKHNSEIIACTTRLPSAYHQLEKHWCSLPEIYQQFRGTWFLHLQASVITRKKWQGQKDRMGHCRIQNNHMWGRWR